MQQFVFSKAEVGELVLPTKKRPSGLRCLGQYLGEWSKPSQPL
jgi:hypothetical protein